MALKDILETCRDNMIISDMFTKSNQIINNSNYKNIVCSISGGADSDVMLDVIEKVRNPDVNVTYVWFDTGIEYQATKDHLKYLENRYDIQICRERAVKSIPICTKEYGQPFLSKFVSEAIGGLQKYGFKFEDKPYEQLIQEYPKCAGYLKWWCNEHEVKQGYSVTMFNIAYNKYLKEFLIANPPWFKISKNCCTYAKKKVSANCIKNYNCDLMCMGLRKSEGGVRSRAYTGCYSITKNGTDFYRPLFWMNDEIKSIYEKRYKIAHSRCYTEYGFLRTGCVCCPYAGLNLVHQLQQTLKYEPNMYKAVNNIFKDSYEYTKQYNEFKRKMKAKSKGIKLLF